jgi:hypothetical protein
MRVGTPGRGGAPQLHRARGPAEGVRLLFAAAGARARITDDGGRRTEGGGADAGRRHLATQVPGKAVAVGRGQAVARCGEAYAVGRPWSGVGCRWILDLGIAPRLLTTRYCLRATGGRCESGMAPLPARRGQAVARCGVARAVAGPWSVVRRQWISDWGTACCSLAALDLHAFRGGDLNRRDGGRPPEGGAGVGRRYSR